MTQQSQQLPKPANSKRFYYHYNKVKKCLTVHFNGTCYFTEDILCLVPTESHSQKHQPRKIVRGWYNKIKHTNTLTTIL